MKAKKIILYSLLVIIAIAFTFTRVKRINPISWGIHSSINQPMFNNEAINGFDPVAYFTIQKATKGKAEYTHIWNKATWYFVSQENADLFKENPEKYAPQFGGYCAFAASKGFTANTDPTAFTIIDAKLYLCADEQFLKEWKEGGTESKKKSENNWK